MKEKESNNKVALVFISLYLFILVFFSESQALTNNGVVIPFIKFNPTYLLLAIIGLGFLYVLFFQNVKIDIILVLLFVRIMLCLIPPLTGDVAASYLGNFISACFPFFVYIFFRNCRIDIKKSTSIFILFGVIIALQCILAYFFIRTNGYANYGDPFYKKYFVIPIGATNDASAALIPLFIVGDQVIPKFKLRFLYAVLMLTAVFLCKSRTGMILCVAYLFYKLFIAERGKHSIIKKIMILCIPAIGILFLPWFINSSLGSSVKELFLGFSEEGQGLNALFSGRLSLFGDVLEHISHHLIFGNGVSYEKLGFMRTHNVFLQMAYENGLVGLMFFIVFLVVCIKTVYKVKDVNNYYHAFYIATPFILINAMVEESMLTNFMIMFVLLFIASMVEMKEEELSNV